MWFEVHTVQQVSSKDFKPPSRFQSRCQRTEFIFRWIKTIRTVIYCTTWRATDFMKLSVRGNGGFGESTSVPWVKLALWSCPCEIAPHYPNYMFEMCLMHFVVHSCMLQSIISLFYSDFLHICNPPPPDTKWSTYIHTDITTFPKNHSTSKV